MDPSSGRGCGNNLMVVIIGLIAGIIAIFAFITGFDNLPEIIEWANNFDDDSAELSPTPRSLVKDFQTISLETWSELTSPETNLGINPGRNLLLDIPFETGWKASTQCSHLPNQPESFLLETNIPNPSHVYLLIQAGYGYTEYEGNQIGNVRLYLSDGIIDTPLTLGGNIRDWAWENPVAVNSASSSSLRPAVLGEAPDGTPGGMDILTINIPSNLSGSNLTGIELSDLSMDTSGGINPCIHLVALTVEYLH